MTKSDSSYKEKTAFFEENFYNEDDPLVVVGVDNSSKKCYLEGPLLSEFKENFFEMPFKGSHFNTEESGHIVCVTDLGIRGRLSVSKNEDFNFHLPWKYVVYMASVRDGHEPVIKKW
jgi:hypothetical protein